MVRLKTHTDSTMEYLQTGLTEEKIDEKNNIAGEYHRRIKEGYLPEIMIYQIRKPAKYNTKCLLPRRNYNDQALS